MKTIIACILIVLLFANLLRGIAQAARRQDSIMEEEWQARNN